MEFSGMRFFFFLVVFPFFVPGFLGVAKPAEPAGAEPRPTSSAGWPVFRGNSLQTGVATARLPEKLAVLWKFQTKDSVESTAAIAAGVVYIGSQDEHLYALDLATGKERWQYKTGPIKAPVSVLGQAVLVGDNDGLFHCVDASTGKKAWTFETGGDISAGANFSEDRILFGGYGDETLYCLSREGKVIWKFKTQGPVNGSPVVAGDRTFVAGCDGALHVVETSKGKETAAIELGGPAGATAAVRGEALYVGTISNNTVLAIDLKQNKVAWTFEAAKNPQPFYASAAVTDKLVIVGCRNRNVYALDRQTGKEVWQFATGGKVDSSPVVVGERVYVGSLDGNLYVLELNKGTEIQRLKLGRRGIAGSPAVAEGRLVIGTVDGAVICLGEGPK